MKTPEQTFYSIQPTQETPYVSWRRGSSPTLHFLYLLGKTLSPSPGTIWPKNVTYVSKNSHFENLAYNPLSLKIRRTILS